jgi:Holliday junction DNA helicase RuvA
MIASLRGRLKSLSVDGAVIDVGGVGFLVYIPTSTLSRLGVEGSEVSLFTYFHLREDAATLYGFSTEEELGFFKTLLNVSGLGPRLALSMLSAMDVKQLAVAIASGNSEMLIQIPGIGRKMAGRLVVELKDKITAGWAALPDLEITDDSADVLAALTSLGYSVTEATKAITSLPTEATALELEERLKLALGYFDSK